MTDYFRPLARTDAPRPVTAFTLAGGWCWFDQVEVLRRDAAPTVVPAHSLDDAILTRLCAPRADIAGMAMDAPRIMGILNVTPDSFSDGGQFNAPEAAMTQAQVLIDGGADILDIGGESTRPGAAEVPVDQEITRTAPVITALRGAGVTTPISIDTRKAAVGAAAMAAGADLINDVAAFTFDPALLSVAVAERVPVCVMHAQGTPETMQSDPRYDDVVMDVYDALSGYVEICVAAGLRRDQITVDPGIGFGKTLEHNIKLLKSLSIFHGLGCPILLGASRKRFIGVIGDVPEAADRMPGSVAVAMAAAAQGVQILRVHDVAATRQALRLTQAMWG